MRRNGRAASVADQYVDDCGFRMLEPYEIAAAMAFPDRYIPRSLSKKDQVKLAGNAVTPPVMTWIVGRILQALGTA
jgi:DNA (cytosine-5)-methyltransferase 1